MNKLLDAGDVFYLSGDRYLYLGYMCGNNFKIDCILVFNYTLRQFEFMDCGIENVEFEVVGKVSTENEISSVLLHVQKLLDQGFSIIG